MHSIGENRQQRKSRHLGWNLYWTDRMALCERQRHVGRIVIELHDLAVPDFAWTVPESERWNKCLHIFSNSKTYWFAPVRLAVRSVPRGVIRGCLIEKKTSNYNGDLAIFKSPIVSFLLLLWMLIFTLHFLLTCCVYIVGTALDTGRFDLLLHIALFTDYCSRKHNICCHVRYSKLQNGFVMA